jgi:hypothetical protein
MFKITNKNNGKTFTHHTKMGMEQDTTILFRYGVPIVVEEIGEENSMDDFGFKSKF